MLLGVVVQALLGADNFKAANAVEVGAEGTPLTAYELEVLRNVIKRQSDETRDLANLFAIALVVGGSTLVAFSG